MRSIGIVHLPAIGSIELSDPDETRELYYRLCEDFENSGLTNYSLDITIRTASGKEAIVLRVRPEGYGRTTEIKDQFVRSIDYHLGRDQYNIVV